MAEEEDLVAQVLEAVVACGEFDPLQSFQWNHSDWRPQQTCTPDWLKYQQPQLRAQLCPVCEGSGVYFKNPWNPSIGKQCHGCDGKGWVKV